MSVYQNQKVNKPKIEEIIPAHLDGEMKTLALDFVNYLREKKMSPIWASGNSWKLNNKGKGICYIKLDNEKWTLIPLLNHLNKYKDMVVSERLQNIIWDNLSTIPCVDCNPRCPPRISRTILGKDFTNRCYGHSPIHFVNPNKTTIDCIKKLLDLERKEREESSKSPIEHFRFYTDI